MEENIKDLIEIGDMLDIVLSTIDEEPETLRIVLVSEVGQVSNDISTITINSPLGKAIYKQDIHGEYKYKVNDTLFNVKILNRVCEKEKVLKNEITF